MMRDSPGPRSDRLRVGRRRAAVPCTAGLLLCLAWMAPRAAPLIEAEARVGGGYDTNVYEAVSSAREVRDSYGLLELGLHLQARRAPLRRGAHASLRWAADRFRVERRETRHILWGEVGWRFANRRRALELTGSATRRTFPADPERDVTRYELATALQWRWGRTARLRIEGAGVFADTDPNGPAERRGWRANGEYRHLIGGRWQAFQRIESRSVRYERRVRGECPPGYAIGPYDRQEAETYLVGVGIARTGSPLVQLFYGLRATTSNVSTLSHQRHEVRLHAGWLLPARVTAQVMVRWNVTSYCGAGCLAVLADEDPEDPDLWEQNSVVLQLRRPVGAGVAAEVRAAWQRNEAPIPGRYYEKGSLQIALMYGGARLP
ncbi:MAG: hypothetical protein GF330_13105 [Candidatus Eisenbacteria bacterium]|nr:hypothetical protein [Candidatus Eisenbacteria bacterium]